MNICPDFCVLRLISAMICRVITNVWVSVVFLGSSPPFQNLCFEEMLYVCSKQGL